MTKSPFIADNFKLLIKEQMGKLFHMYARLAHDFDSEPFTAMDELDKKIEKSLIQGLDAVKSPRLKNFVNF